MQGSPHRVNDALRSAREALTLGQADLARAINRIGMQQGAELRCSVRHIAKWESGEITWPQARYRRALESLTGLPSSLLGFVAPPRRQSSGEQPLSAEAEEDSVHRRQFLTAATAVVAASGAGFPFIRPSEAAPATLGRIDEVEHTVAELTDLDRRFGSGQLLPLIETQLRELEGLLNTGTDTPRVRSVASGGYLLAGWMYFDAGIQNKARQFYKEALFLAQTAGDRTAVACTASTMSMQSAMFGSPHEAVHLAKLGSDNAPRKGRLASLLAMREARGWSRLGDAREAAKAVRRSQVAHEKSAADPDWVNFFSEGELVGGASDVAFDLGKYEEAEPLARAGVADTSLPMRALAASHLYLAEVLAKKGDFDDAATAAGEALPMLPGLSSARIRGRVSVLLKALPPLEARQDRWRQYQAYA